MIATPGTAIQPKVTAGAVGADPATGSAAGADPSDGGISSWMSLLAALGLAQDEPARVSTPASQTGDPVENVDASATRRAALIDPLRTGKSGTNGQKRGTQILPVAATEIGDRKSKLMTGSRSAGADLARERKLKRDGEEAAGEKSVHAANAEIGTIVAAAVAAPVTGVSKEAPVLAKSEHAGGKVSITRDLRSDGTAIRHESISETRPQGDPQSPTESIAPRADTDRRGVFGADEKITPKVAEAEMAPSNPAKDRGNTTLEVGLPSNTVASADVNASLPTSAPKIDLSAPRPVAASAKKGQASNSIPERAAKSIPKVVADSTNFDPRPAAIESVHGLAPTYRETGRIATTTELKAGPSAQRVASEAVNPFATLDSERNAPAPAWIHAGTHHAEAGYLDPDLGWIGIRANAAPTGVHAAVVPASGEAAQVLAGHMAGLNAYLSQHHEQPATVSMAAPQDSYGGGMEAHSGNRQAGSQDQPSARETSPFFSTHPSGRVEARTAGMSPARELTGSGEGHISVMA